MKKKRVVVLGATGSIGESTLRVVRAMPDHLEIFGLSGRNNTASLLELAREFPAAHLCTGGEQSAAVYVRSLKTVASFTEKGVLRNWRRCPKQI